MSIYDVIKSHEGRELFCVESAFYGEETPRCVFVSEEVGRLLWEPDDHRTERLGHNSAALLDYFIEGQHITAGMDPHNKADCLMARVDSKDDRYEIWDVRCLDPKPGVRILGGFAGKDCFIALTWNYRENFDDEWPEKIKDCISEWRRLFGGITPFKGRRIEDYISEPCSAC